MTRWKNIAFIVMLAAIFVELVILLPNKINVEKNKETRDQKKLDHELSNQPDQILKGVHFVESQKGQRDWELFSSETQGGQSQKSWNLKNVKILFYSKSKVEFTVIGDQAFIETESRDILVKGSVKTISANNYSMYTTDVRYKATERLIVTDSEVKLRGPSSSEEGLTAEGVGLVMEVDSGLIKLQKNIRAERIVQNADPVLLTSESAEFSSRHQQILLQGTVRLEQKPYKVEGDLLEILQNSNNKLEKIVVKGRAKLSSENLFATSDTITFDASTFQVRLDGRPKVYQNEDEISGERIIFQDRGKKMKVEQMRAKTPGKQ